MYIQELEKDKEYFKPS